MNKTEKTKRTRSDKREGGKENIVSKSQEGTTQGEESSNNCKGTAVKT